MKNIFYSYKDFLMCNNIVILDYFDAVKYLNISNKQKQILQAVKLENKIKIINKYVICPYCGNKILPYNKHKFSKIPKNIIKLFGSETFADEFKDISFNILEYDAIKFKCSYCLNTGIISENKTKFRNKIESTAMSSFQLEITRHTNKQETVTRKKSIF